MKQLYFLRCRAEPLAAPLSSSLKPSLCPLPVPYGTPPIYSLRPTPALSATGYGTAKQLCWWIYWSAGLTDANFSIASISRAATERNRKKDLRLKKLRAALRQNSNPAIRLSPRLRSLALDSLHARTLRISVSFLFGPLH